VHETFVIHAETVTIFLLCAVGLYAAW